MSKYTQLLSEEIRERIESFIEDNGLAPGSPIPSERELSELFSANRATVHKAIVEMLDENVLTKSGRRCFVAPPKRLEEESDHVSFTENWRKRGHEVTNRLVHLIRIEADSRLMKTFNVPNGTKFFELKRVRAVDGEPFCIETSFVPVSLCPGLDKEDFTGDASLYDTIGRLAQPITRQHQTMHATVMKSEEAELLDAKEGDCAFHTIGVGMASDGRPLEKSISIARADHYAVAFNVMPSQK